MQLILHTTGMHIPSTAPTYIYSLRLRHAINTAIQLDPLSTTTITKRNQYRMVTDISSGINKNVDQIKIISYLCFNQKWFKIIQLFLNLY